MATGPALPGPAPSPAPASDQFACVANLAGSGTDFLSLRQAPSARAGEITRLKARAGLIVGGRTDNGNWTNVGVPGGPSGWVSTKYLQPVANIASCKSDQADNPKPPPPEPKPTELGFACVDYLGSSGDAFLSLREQPSPSSGEIARLPAGSALAIDRTANGRWVGVRVLNGQAGSGWVNAKYLRRVADPKTCTVEVATTKPGGDTKPDGKGEPGVDEPVDEVGCDQAADLDKEGNPVIPAGAVDITPPVAVDEDRGLISDLYPDLDTTTDAFYPNLPCDPSIGGTLPAGINEKPTQDEIDAEKYLDGFEADTAKGIAPLEANPMPPLAPVPAFTVGDCFIRKEVVPCDSPLFLQANQPFEGRDIIYVQGLSTDNLQDYITNEPGARQPWVGPQDPGTVAEYLNPNGYFRKVAQDYWRDHIRENLFDADHPSNHNAGWQFTSADSQPRYFPKANRYLLVAWSSSTTIEYAQSALLNQIHLAMTTNLNVVTPPTYPTQFVRPFCSNGCIIISHSTGPLVVSSAMGMAYAGEFGPGGKQIPDRIFAQVSFEGAISGTRTATVALVVAWNPVPGYICTLFDAAFPNLGCNSAGTSFLSTSILRDLMPIVAQGVWGRWIGVSPVRTVTVAGSHPTGKAGGALKLFLPGLDDGVVSMNSACGNPNPVFPPLLAASGAEFGDFFKAFEFTENGGRLARSVKLFLSNLNYGGLPSSPVYLAVGCTPYVSPTGMVLPATDPLTASIWDSRRRYNNYYSFLQATTGHSYDGGSEADAGNPWPSSIPSSPGATRRYLDFLTFSDDVEESLAVTDSAIYARDANGTYLVKPIPVHEIVRGRKLSFRIPKPIPYNHARCPNRWCAWWIWKRTYHLPDKWEVKQTSHYVYEFVARR